MNYNVIHTHVVSMTLHIIEIFDLLVKRESSYQFSSLSMQSNRFAKMSAESRHYASWRDLEDPIPWHIDASTRFNEQELLFDFESIIFVEWQSKTKLQWTNIIFHHQWKTQISEKIIYEVTVQYFLSIQMGYTSKLRYHHTDDWKSKLISIILFWKYYENTQANCCELFSAASVLHLSISSSRSYLIFIDLFLIINEISKSSEEYSYTWRQK